MKGFAYRLPAAQALAFLERNESAESLPGPQLELQALTPKRLKDPASLNSG